ncbi:hypothetical protein GCM10009096_21680 [Parasphingorhabdus litoris]|uniref:DUF389 domain-containing protein n=1 Tax=Parasphingorhabdus litoris TaxID=394733 RepID=A0ABN1AL53_9SPHN|nr:DUF389 domain-containing protein [Parasphingorhabdus litoris]
MTEKSQAQAGSPGSEPEKEPGPFEPVTGSILLFRRWWRVVVCSGIDQPAVIAKVKEDSFFNPRYAFMTCMSAGIAILGLLLSSPAVVIGAMLLSPLMGPIMGAGFALAIGDYAWLKGSAKALVLGTLVAVLFAAFVVALSPLQTVTSEIASRTRPNLFDLAVALFSALAGAYAMIRGRMGTIVGVAIATALMPPLAVVGFGLATLNMSVFGGSLLLFFTNLMTIALAAAGMARLYGFRSSLSERQSQFQIGAMVVIFIGLAIPLGYSLQQIAWEANVSRQANGYIKDQFGSRARVSQIDIDWDAEPILVSASVFTPKIVGDAEQQSARVLSRTFNRPIDVAIEQYRVETGSDAVKAELTAARAQQQAQEAEIRVVKLRENLALVAGVPADDVTIDTTKRRALVTAKPLQGATLDTYYALEKRIADQALDWTIEIKPPAVALPSLEVTDGAISERSSAQLPLIGWAAARVQLPLGAYGAPEDVEVARKTLLDTHATTIRTSGLSDASGTVRLRWLSPQDAEQETE